MHRVVVLAVDGVIPFELSIASRILGIAEDAAQHPLYEVITCTPDGAPVATDADFSVTVAYDGSVLATADTVIVPASETMAKITGPESLSASLADALALVRPATRMVSICLGSYVLAAAGLLDGLPATTHWRYAGNFQRLFPRVDVKPDVLFVDAGQVLTSAGAAAGVDLCLHLLRRDHGSGIANHVARCCVIPPWRDGGQAQYVERPVPEISDNGTAPTRAWVLDRLDQSLRLEDLAVHAGMSRRTFTRRFRAETGQSPGQWLTQQRVELARHLLEHSELPVDKIAERSGFGTAASLRQHLHQAIAVSPITYRRTFRAQIPGPSGGVRRGRE